MLRARHRVAGLGTGIDTVVEERLLRQIKAHVLEMLIPVRKLDDDPDPGIDFAGGAKHQVARHLAHALDPIGGPGTVAPSLDFLFGLAAGEEEIIQDDVIEVPGRLFCHMPHPRTIRGVGVAERLEPIAFVAGPGNSAEGLDPTRREKCLGLLERPGIHQQRVAVGLQVHLVDLDRVRNDRPGLLQPLVILHPVDFIRARVHRDAEVTVVISHRPWRPGRLRKHRRRREAREQCGREPHRAATSPRASCTAPGIPWLRSGGSCRR